MRRVFLVVGIIVLFFSSSLLWGDNVKYNYEKSREYNCFMKNFEKWKNSELFSGTHIYRILFHTVTNLSDDKRKSEFSLVKKMGRELYKKHKKEIDKIILNFDEILKEKIRPYDWKSGEERHIDFNYTRAITKNLIAISSYFFINKNYRKTLKLLLLQVKFGINVIDGSECMPNLLTRVIGINILDRSINKLLWKSIYSSNYSSKEYLLLSKKLENLLNELDDFREFIISDKKSILASLKSRMNKNEKEKDIYSPIIDELSSSEAKKVYPVFKKELDNSYKRILKIFEKNRENYSNYDSEEYKYFQEISKNSKLSVYSIFSPIETTSRLLLTIAFPPYSRTYSKYREVKMKLEFLILYCKLLSKRDKKLKSMDDFITYIKKHGYKDYYNGIPLKIKKMKNSVLIYSVGKNMKDDGGKESSDDFVIIQLYGK